MIAWLYNIIIGNFKKCNHEWEIIQDLIDSDDIRWGILQQCKKCGILYTFRPGR